MNSNSKYSEIKQAINNGSIFSLPRSKLELYVAELSRSQAFSHFGASEFPRICETVRMALSIKVSEDANLQAKRESRIALFVSFTALVVGIVSACAALWPLIFPKAVQVYSTQSNPVHVAEPFLPEKPAQKVTNKNLSKPRSQQEIEVAPAPAKKDNQISKKQKAKAQQNYQAN
jgi:hypothetical protein